MQVAMTVSSQLSVYERLIGVIVCNVDLDASGDEGNYQYRCRATPVSC